MHAGFENTLPIRPLRVLSFDLALSISGITSWNLRSAREFAANPGHGIDWTCVNVTTQMEFDAVRSSVPALDAKKMMFVAKGPSDSGWSVLGRGLRRYSEWTSADVIIPNGILAGWQLVDHLWRIQRKRPAVVGSIHNDMDIAYQMSGEGVFGCDANFAVSRHCQKEFTRRYPLLPEPAFIPYGVPVASTPQVPLPDGPLRVVYCGRIAQEQKRAMDLVPLVRNLLQRKTDFLLHVLGDGPALPALREAIESMAGDRCIIHGSVQTDKVLEILQKTDAIVSVSAFEGTSISMLEAMGQGVVPVVTDIASGVRDVIEEGRNGWMVPVGDMNAMADVLHRLSMDRESLASAAKAAWGRIKDEYSISASAAALARLLREASDQPRGEFRLLQHAIWTPNRLEQPWMPNWLVYGLREMRRKLTG